MGAGKIEKHLTHENAIRDQNHFCLDLNNCYKYSCNIYLIIIIIIKTLNNDVIFVIDRRAKTVNRKTVSLNRHHAP